ncbi:MAG TPA: PKD domain-containing protein, partial [Thermoanaerobaculia bacterium]|nr:PKD domain-containing protein [Thermoanaerobaculia bacterium]
GDSGYYAAKSGNVWMRKVTGGCYSYQTFRTAVMHELGHTLGLGHSDQGTSVHSNTPASDWASAVMVSSVPPSRPSTPQNDDIQAILWYYGSGACSGSGAVAPTADFSFSPTAPSAGEAVRFLDASAGGATSWAWSFGDAAAGLANFSSLANPVHVFPAPGSYTVTLTATNASGSSRVTRAVIISGCVPGPDALCFDNGRFRATVFWRVPSQGISGPGWAVPITGASGYFWFFSPSNVELIVKVLDGRAVNGDFWVFYGALSDVEYTLTVTDTKTGAVKSYFNPAGRLASAADTAAFASDTQPGAPDLAAPAAGEPQEAPCSPDPGILCLNGSRFRVRVSWRVPSQGTQGTATAVPLTTDTGYFWFFGSGTPELVVKVLDGRAVNGRFWVFSGALSDVEYTITVTDTLTGAVRTYQNPSGSLSSLADTAAF